MLYNPSAFQEQDPEIIHAFIQAQGKGLFITSEANGLQSTFLPFVLYPHEGKNGVLRAHFARGNAHWKELRENTQCLVVFAGENGYITPSWYATKAQSGKVVPTWNYEMVEVRGVATAVEDTGWLRRLLTDLTKQHERTRPEPWHLDDAPPDFLAVQLKGIVGLEIVIHEIEGKWKMSQNKTAEDRSGVVVGLSDEADPHHNPELAALVNTRMKR
ncbi:FMN-binding negative transcriptional regulator [Limnobacter litoralis]|uniref:Transcriptional regulator n=1 Tax=Limnobacter litoralis TaxID=481366 RepID=A0ABQ5YRD7_9BURK|nr:FMN-binding negative transcriptional regulator [Limnobacter litoralis]GLR25007.1 transcriptional regulator [Limnobacter litoralis]